MKCNHLDLNLFQIDWDLTFGVLFLNADKTVYARYGTRSGHKADDDVSIEGLAETMRAVLGIHRDYPENKVLLDSKQPKKHLQSIPEDFESLDHFKPRLDYDGQVAKSCIHCHQVRDAARSELRNAGKTLPEKLLFPFPSLRLFGATLDTKSRTTVARVESNSALARLKLNAGDEIETINEQVVHSEADIQWLLHNLPDGTKSIALGINRQNDHRVVHLDLPEGWRSGTDLSWRPTTWDLRRMATGGMTLIPLSDAQRRKAGIDEANMALRADHVGQYGHHARARKAGIRKNDVIVSFDGRQDLQTEGTLIEHAIQNRKPGDEIEIQYLRNGNLKTTTIKLQ